MEEDSQRQVMQQNMQNMRQLPQMPPEPPKQSAPYMVRAPPPPPKQNAPGEQQLTAASLIHAIITHQINQSSDVEMTNTHTRPGDKLFQVISTGRNSKLDFNLICSCCRVSSESLPSATKERTRRPSRAVSANRWMIQPTPSRPSPRRRWASTSTESSPKTCSPSEQTTCGQEKDARNHLR
jgi:hypothetical protein